MLKTVSSITNAIGAVNYKGTWNASTNTPDLPAQTTMQKGDYYVVSVAGSTSLGGITTWFVGDWAVYNGSAWQRVEGGSEAGSILQVVQTASSSIFTSINSATFAGTGLSASITPKLSTSKILILVMANFRGSGYQTQATIYRGATNLAGANGMLMLNNNGQWLPLHMSYLDSPSTTSPTTYEVYWRNTTGLDSYFGGDGSQTVTMTLMEVAA